MLFTRGKKAAIICIQITLESLVKHSASLCWFRSNDFEKQLANRGYKVLKTFLFICNTTTADDLKTHIKEADDKHVFDYPLDGFLSYTKFVVGSNVNPLCRKLNVVIKKSVFFDRHSAILSCHNG